MSVIMSVQSMKCLQMPTGRGSDARGSPQVTSHSLDLPETDLPESRGQQNGGYAENWASADSEVEVAPANTSAQIDQVTFPVQSSQSQKA
jgi:hypothetical protein